MKTTLDFMLRLACRIQSELAPLCDRIEIAGSIRRFRPICNDIDLVIIPKDLASVRSRILANTHPIESGLRNLMVTMQNGIQLDVFFAHHDIKNLFDITPSNFGSLLLCRTGSKQHNIKLCLTAQKMRLRWDPYRGLFSGEDIIASRTEEEIFEALKMDYVLPAKREA